ncbi:MAG: alkaline phosphatase family protein [Tannerella sp.]|jgi:hypothetical protein|nr:alkaline phosphatase family protein [Tannerella sp.]
MRKIVTSLIAVLVAANMQAQQQNAPKLVVCITVDQLRGDYLEYFMNSFGERGFKRLLNEGVVYRHVQFEFSNIDQASAFATIFTGANPCYHSITGSRRYDLDREQEQSCLHDEHYLGNYTHQNYSPKNMLSSTIGDELKLASKGAGLVFAIAPEAESAIISAGHTADGAFWIDDFNGKWATTTFYKNIPKYVDKFNSGAESLSARLPSLVWSPMMPDDHYNALPYVVDKKPYRYKYDEKEFGCYQRFKTSALVNAEVNRLALQFIDNGNIGAHPVSDMLSITFYGGNYLDVQDKTYTREVQDTYFALDKNIEELLDAIDKKIGLSKTLIILTGTGYYTDNDFVREGETATGGTFHPKQCTALLNIYLRAIYGQKNWVRAYHNQQIFLNRKTIDEEKISLAEIQSKAADFLSEFSGVQQVITDMLLRAGEWNEGSANLRYGSYHIGRGDLIIELQPGWGIESDEVNQKKTSIKRNNAVITPLIIYGNGLKPARMERSVYATQIAPTVTNALRIRAPNACSDLPLTSEN